MQKGTLKGECTVQILKSLFHERRRKIINRLLMLLQVLKKLLRDDVVARARIIVNEVWFPLLQQEQPEL